MADNKNMELNDEMMAKASGGKLEPGQEVVTISGIVMANPRPDDSIYGSVWDECQAGGYQVYEADGRLLVAGSHLPGFNPGDQVIINQIRGFYGWEIIEIAL
ncbi:MAG: hypothetical protein K6C41_05740 [Lachnospiraceae bacterium]|nr:hypothetical protein [Lachnospiraceae bacterium]